MNNTQKWGAKDVISVILFSMLLMIIQLIITTVCMVNIVLSAVFSFAIIGLICAPIYFLMVSKINKHYVTFIYCVLLGLIYFFMGHWSTIFLFLFMGIVSELILWKENSCLNFKKVSLAWIVQSVLYIGVNLMSVLFFWDDYLMTAESQGMSIDYANAYSTYYTQPMWLTINVVVTIIFAAVGCLLGKKILEKHFKKAGVL